MAILQLSESCDQTEQFVKGFNWKIVVDEQHLHGEMVWFPGNQVIVSISVIMKGIDIFHLHTKNAKDRGLKTDHECCSAYWKGGNFLNASQLCSFTGGCINVARFSNQIESILLPRNWLGTREHCSAARITLRHDRVDPPTGLHGSGHPKLMILWRHVPSIHYSAISDMLVILQPGQKPNSLHFSTQPGADSGGGFPRPIPKFLKSNMGIPHVLQGISLLKVPHGKLLKDSEGCSRWDDRLCNLTQANRWENRWGEYWPKQRANPWKGLSSSFQRALVASEWLVAETYEDG